MESKTEFPTNLALGDLLFLISISELKILYKLKTVSVANVSWFGVAHPDSAMRQNNAALILCAVTLRYLTLQKNLFNSVNRYFEKLISVFWLTIHTCFKIVQCARLIAEK